MIIVHFKINYGIIWKLLLKDTLIIYACVDKYIADCFANCNYWHRVENKTVENEIRSLQTSGHDSSRRQSIEISWAGPEISKRPELTNRGHQHRNLLLPPRRYFRIHVDRSFTTALAGRSILIKSSQSPESCAARSDKDTWHFYRPF